MTEENKQYSSNDLAHVKYTADSNTKNSIVQVFETNQTPEQIRHNELICKLDELVVLMKKTNTYLGLMMDLEI